MPIWKPGDRVEHGVFGAGTVLQADELHTVVHFDDRGRRKFASALVVLRPGATPATSSAPSVSAAIGTAQSRPAGNTPAANDTPSTIDQLIDLARRRVGSEESLNEFVSTMRRALRGPDQQHVGILSGMRVQGFQNWLLDENPNWQLTDAQLLAVMRVEFPLATGLVFTGDVDAGLQHIAGIRAHYNRDGHHGPSPTSREMPLSVSYGRF